jgi:hypothetical protein
VNKHGEHFNWYADKINEKEGKKYISQYADDTDFQVTGDSGLLNWSDDVDDDDLGDALDHSNLQRNRSMQKGFSDLDLLDIETVDPRKVLPAKAFKGKPYGWLKEIPKEDWISEFKKVFDRDISYILKASDSEGISPVIVIDGDLADGFARTQLAYSLGESLPVGRYEGVV